MQTFGQVNRPKPAMLNFAGSGVHPGGAISRPNSLHMGHPGAQGGGQNMFGSQPKPHSPGLNNAHGIGPTRPTPSLAPNYLHSVNTAQAKQHAAAIHRQAVSHATGNGSIHRVTPKPTLVPGIYHAPTAPGPVNTHDSGYASDQAAANYKYDMAGQPITDMRGQLTTLQPQYQLGLTDLNNSNNRSQYASNANLAARGLSSSGGQVMADTNLHDAYGKNFTALENQYGTAAANRIQGQIDQAEAARLGGRSLDMTNAEGAALNRYNENLAKNPPSAPIGTHYANLASWLPTHTFANKLTHQQQVAAYRRSVGLA